MSMLAESGSRMQPARVPAGSSVDAAVGVDTHLDTHVLVMVNLVGVVLGTIAISNDDAGFAAALGWIQQTAPGPGVVAGLEGTRSYGIGLNRFLQAGGIPVLEIARANRRERRRQLRGVGKSDSLDAHRAAVAVLAMLTGPRPDRAAGDIAGNIAGDAAHCLHAPAAVPVPRADGHREALRILLRARDQMTRTRTQAVNALRALLALGDGSSQDDTDRRIARSKGLSAATLTALTNRTSTNTSGRWTAAVVQQRVRAAELARLAHIVLDLDRQLKANKQDLTALLKHTAPQLLNIYGVGPVTAAQAYVSWSHPGRCRHEAAFAALAGVNPIPASSGKITRHRLNRGGDRQLNRALHTIACTRARGCPRTRAYIERRRAQGRTDRDIRRCLKRYIARELFHALNALDNT